MKKLLILLLAFPLFISCSSDETEELPNAFRGTKWEYAVVDVDSHLTHTLTFTSNTECNIVIKGYFVSEVNDTFRYTYEIVSDNQLILTPQVSSMNMYNANIEGNNMSLYEVETNDFFITLTKIN